MSEDRPTCGHYRDSTGCRTCLYFLLGSADAIVAEGLCTKVDIRIEEES